MSTLIVPAEAEAQMWALLRCPWPTDRFNLEMAAQSRGYHTLLRWLRPAAFGYKEKAASQEDVDRLILRVKLANKTVKDLSAMAKSAGVRAKGKRALMLAINGLDLDKQRELLAGDVCT